MAYGDGSITEVKKKDGTSYSPKHWRVRIDRGTDPTTNRRRKPLSRTVIGTKTQARKVRDEMRRELDQGLKLDADKMTFREMCALFQRVRKGAGKVKPKQLKSDECRLNLMCEVIGDLPLKKVTADVIEELYPEIKRRRNAQGYNCGSSTLHAYHVLLKSVMKKAVNFDYILRNPCDRVDAPPMDPVTRRSLTTAEAQKLLSAVNASEAAAIADLQAKEARQKVWKVDDDRSFVRGMRPVCFVLAVRIGLATGMRLGEVLGLTWGHLRGNIITVYRDMTKTDAGFRRVAIDQTTVKHLQDWKELQAGLLPYVGKKQTEETPLLCNSLGNVISSANFETWWRDWRAANGFPDLQFHELRHTQATQLLGNFVDLKTVQTRLGHSDPSITLKWYAHAIPENDQAAADLIGDLFEGKKKARIIELQKPA